MPLSAEDKWAVLDLVTRMYVSLDAKDAEAYSSAFMEDGTFTHPYGGQMSSRDEVRSWVEGYIAQGHQDGGRHCVVNPMIVADPAGAKIKCYVIRMKVDVDPVTIATGGLEATVVRNGSEWSVQHQKVTVDAMPGA